MGSLLSFTSTCGKARKGVIMKVDESFKCGQCNLTKDRNRVYRFDDIDICVECFIENRDVDLMLEMKTKINCDDGHKYSRAIEQPYPRLCVVCGEKEPLKSGLDNIDSLTWSGHDLVKITYTNYKGITSERVICPKGIGFMQTEWHKEWQWILYAMDVEKKETRYFAIKDISEWEVYKNEA
jgi:hypothetical protein